MTVIDLTDMTDLEVSQYESLMFLDRVFSEQSEIEAVKSPDYMSVSRWAQRRVRSDRSEGMIQ